MFWRRRRKVDEIMVLRFAVLRALRHMDAGSVSDVVAGAVRDWKLVNGDG